MRAQKGASSAGLLGRQRSSPEPTKLRERRTGMKRLAWCLSLVALAAACGSSGRVSNPGSASTTRGGANTTSTSSRITPTHELRGIPVRNFQCPPRPASSRVSSIPIEGVQALLLCPTSAPGRSLKTVKVGANQPSFEVLVSALSAADEPPTSGAVCPAYADLLQYVLAKTRTGEYQVSIPTDACGHYQRGALDALNDARRS
jgi:hypothetical protein